MIVVGVQVTAKPGRAGDLGALLPDMRTMLTDASGEQWFAWAGMGGDQSFGTFMLSTRADGMAHMMSMRQSIVQHGDFPALAGKMGEVMAAPALEYANDVIHVSGEPADGPLPVTQVTTAALAPGHWRAGGAWAVEVADHVSSVTGVSLIVAASALGPMGSLSWLGGVQDFAALDSTNAALNGDSSYMEMLDQGGEHFVAGSGVRGVLAQLP